jgi:hypothetical protein
MFTWTIIAAGVVGLVYLPLGLSVLESHLFGTGHLEDFFELVGLHGILDAIYDATTGM